MEGSCLYGPIILGIHANLQRGTMEEKNLYRHYILVENILKCQESYCRSYTFWEWFSFSEVCPLRKHRDSIKTLSVFAQYVQDMGLNGVTWTTKII